MGFSAKSSFEKFLDRSELTQRIVSALVLVAIALPLIVLGGVATWIMALVLFGFCFYEWQTITRNRETGSRVGYVILGLLYCGLALTLPIIRNAEMHNGLFLLILLFLAVIASDVFAYFSGRALGGPKLLPAVSPKKTWSGALGGFFGAVLIGVVFVSVFPQVPMAHAAIGAGVLSIFSQAGDLFESWIKRRFSVKDSSRLIPGHGGFLDRVDGLLGASLPMLFYVVLTN